MKALSVRQPWAWLIIHGGKDVENRTWTVGTRGRILIHAAKGMSRVEYLDAVDFVDMIRKRWIPGLPTVPAFEALERGGVIGSVEIVDVDSLDDWSGRFGPRWSPWFTGPYGWRLKNPMAVPFEAGRGSLGLFQWGK